MNDNELLARWQGYNPDVCSYDYYMPSGRMIDYPNDPAACMSLLDTLVEKGYDPSVWYSKESQTWWCDPCGRVVNCRNKNRNEAIISACLEVARKELGYES